METAMSVTAVHDVVPADLGHAPPKAPSVMGR